MEASSYRGSALCSKESRNIVLSIPVTKTQGKLRIWVYRKKVVLKLDTVPHAWWGDPQVSHDQERKKASLIKIIKGHCNTNLFTIALGLEGGTHKAAWQRETLGERKKKKHLF